MDTEDNLENNPSDKPKFTGGFANVVFKPKNEEEQAAQEEQQPAKKIKKQATEAQLNHPLHGVKLAHILESLVEYYGWPYLENRVKILCFKYNPTMKASLAFAGEATYDNGHWTGEFSVKETRQYLGVYVLNGLSPSKDAF